MPDSLPRPQRVVACSLTELARALGCPQPPEDSGVVAVTGVTHASGEVWPGDLFAAMPSASGARHGAEFVSAAVAAGARAVLTDPTGAAAAVTAGVPALVVPDPRAVLGTVAARIYRTTELLTPSGSGLPPRLPVIGITGTAGKTSTVYLIEAGLRAAGREPALFSTVQTRIGEQVLDSVRTTPEATDLHALLAAAAQRGVDAVTMEVSSHALALHRVGGVSFEVGGFTNFGTDHLDFHHTPEAYFAAKAALFDGRCRHEIVNADDPAQRGLIRDTTVTYSAAGDPAATWFGSGYAEEGYGQRFLAHGPGIVVPAGVSQPGRHNAANALLAIAALTSLGVDPAVAAAGVAGAGGVPGRMEVITGRDGGVLGIVDYAHKPDAIVAVLAALRPVAQRRGGRLICVLGAGGERDTGKRPHMGAAAAGLADLLVVTDDNPRGEDPAAIRAAVRSGAEGGPAEVLEVPGRRAAIETALARASGPDVVAVLGKGHERGQEIAGEVIPFDDREELAGAVAGLRGGVR